MKFNNETLYTIETNGGVIGFDLADFTNIDRLEQMYNEFEKIQSKFKNKQTLIDKKKDQELTKVGMTKHERDTIENLNNFVHESGKVIDLFFGDKAHEKVFYEPVLDRVLITEPRLMAFFQDMLPKELEKAGIKQEEYVKKRTSRENRERFVDKDEDIKKVG